MPARPTAGRPRPPHGPCRPPGNPRRHRTPPCRTPPLRDRVAPRVAAEWPPALPRPEGASACLTHVKASGVPAEEPCQTVVQRRVIRHGHLKAEGSSAQLVAAERRLQVLSSPVQGDLTELG